MSKRRNRASDSGANWPETWSRVQKTILLLGPPEDILLSAHERNVSWSVRGNEMRLQIPEILIEYIEVNMEFFKPILWPFIQSMRCSKLVYTPTQNTLTAQDYGTEHQS